MAVGPAMKGGLMLNLLKMYMVFSLGVVLGFTSGAALALLGVLHFIITLT